VVNSGDWCKENRDGKNKRKKKRRKKLERKREEKNKKKKQKKGKTMEVKKVAEEWEIWDEKEEVAKSEAEAKKMVPEKYHQ